MFAPRFPIRFATALCALLLLSIAPAASASVASIFNDYQQDGTINSCQHSAADLQAARGQIPNDIQQYAPDYPGALDAALAGQGDCGGGSQTTIPVAPGAPKGPSGPSGPVVDGRIVVHAGPAPAGAGAARKASESKNAAGVLPLVRAPQANSSVPLPILMLAVFAGLALMLGAAWSIGRLAGYDWAPLAPIRHAFGEATLRAENALTAITDREFPEGPRRR